MERSVDPEIGVPVLADDPDNIEKVDFDEEDKALETQISFWSLYRSAYITRCPHCQHPTDRLAVLGALLLGYPTLSAFELDIALINDQLTPMWGWGRSADRVDIFLIVSSGTLMRSLCPIRRYDPLSGSLAVQVLGLIGSGANGLFVS